MIPATGIRKKIPDVSRSQENQRVGKKNNGIYLLTRFVRMAQIPIRISAVKGAKGERGV